MDGQISELRSKARELETKLNSKKMREAEKRFNELFIRIKVSSYVKFIPCILFLSLFSGLSCV